MKSSLKAVQTYEQRIKELFLEGAGILMKKREEIIGDCRAVMEALADCSAIDTEMEAVSSEMEVTAGLIQKLVAENATRKLKLGLELGVNFFDAAIGYQSGNRKF